jgi:hypothetical protein
MGDVMIEAVEMTEEAYLSLKAAFKAGEWIDIGMIETVRPRRGFLLFHCDDLDVPLCGYYDHITMTLEPGATTTGAYILSDKPFEPKEIIEVHPQYGTKASVGWTKRPDNYYVVTKFRFVGEL